MEAEARTVNVVIRLSPSEVADLDRLAAAKHIKRTQWARAALLDARDAATTKPLTVPERAEVQRITRMFEGPRKGRKTG